MSWIGSGRQKAGILAALAWCAATPGMAADTIGLNLEPAVEARHWQAPRFSYGSDDTKGTLYSQQIQQWAPAPGIAVSFEPGQLFILPDWVGERFRYQLRYNRVDDSSTIGGTIGRANNPFLVAIGGSGTIDMATPAATSLQVDHRNDVFSLEVATDFGLWRGITVSPALGVTFGETRQRYRVKILEVSTFRDSVSETVRRRFVGPTFGVQLGAPITDTVKVVAGFGGAVLWSDSKLTGDDCAGIDASGTCDGVFFRSTVDRSFESWGWYGDANLGIEVALGPATARLSGVIDAERARQRVVNPRFNGTGPATLAQETTLGYGARVAVNYPF
jgi:hypothetical protein